jgi:hypothetical protein
MFDFSQKITSAELVKFEKTTTRKNKRRESKELKALT